MRKFILFFCLAVFALPGFGINRVTVRQLEQTLSSLQGRQDKDVAQQLAELELTERISDAECDRLQAGLPGEKSRTALVAVADAAAFLDLPSSEIPKDAQPDRETQGQTLNRAADYVTIAMAKMPDFLARRTTTQFQDMRARQSDAEQTVVTPGIFRSVDSSSAIIRYRNGKDEEAIPAKKYSSVVTSSTGWSSWGSFGPMLAVVVTDILKSKIGWGTGQ